MPGVSAAEAAARNHLSAAQYLVVFEPCLLIQGVLLAPAAWQFIGTRTGRRRWSVSVVAGVVVIGLFGAVLSLSRTQFAIS